MIIRTEIPKMNSKPTRASTRSYLNSLIIIAMLILVADNASAVSVGLSPARIDFNGVLRGGYAERNVRISTSDPIELTGNFEVFGEIEEWLRLDPNEKTISFSSSNPYLLKVIVEPPPDAANGVYSGEIRIITDAVVDPTGSVGASVRASVTLQIFVTVTDQQVYDCTAGGAAIKDSELDTPLIFEWLVRNNGNVRTSPKVSIDIWDREKENLYISREYTSGEVLPTTERTFTQKLSSERLGLGQYWAYIKIKDCDFDTITTFDILEKGAISDRGELLGVDAPPWVYVDDIVPIKAKFVSGSLRDVRAKFKGDIRLDDKIVQLIDSEETIVTPGQQADLTTFFTPKSEGKYVVNGHVMYNSKITYDKSTIINVQPKKFSMTFGNAILVIVYLIIAAAIIFLIRKIQKAKKKF